MVVSVVEANCVHSAITACMLCRTVLMVRAAQHSKGCVSCALKTAMQETSKGLATIDKHTLKETVFVPKHCPTCVERMVVDYSVSLCQISHRIARRVW